MMLFSATIIFSQENTFEKQVSKISKKIEKIIAQEKDSLKIKVTAINLRLEKKEITEEEATQLKKEAAIYHATNIENRVSVQEQKLQKLVQDKADGKIPSKYSETDSEGIFSIGGAKFKIRFDDEYYTKKERKRKSRREKRGYSKRTTTQVVFAAGVNNVLVDGELSSLNNSPYKFWQSHFYEAGFTWKTRLAKKASKTYFKYGFSFLWNNLRAASNQYHVVAGNNTSLLVHADNLSENRLRHVQLVFPMHLEFDFSKNSKYKDGKTRDRTHNAIRFGIGGFAGFNIGSRQYLEYENVQGNEIEEIQKGGFNMNTLNYGLSAYFGYESTSLYVKYDMNTLFKNSNTNNISFGVRFDLD